MPMIFGSRECCDLKFSRATLCENNGLLVEILILNLSGDLLKPADTLHIVQGTQQCYQC